MANPWDIRPQSQMGDRNENDLLNAVGRALTEWENIESACARLFAVFVSPHQQRLHQAPAIRAYGCVVSVKTRCEMLRVAAEAYFETRPKHKVQFDGRLRGLLKEYLAYSDR
jgi:hypothetical protein